MLREPLLSTADAAAGAVAAEQASDYLGPSALAVSPDGQWLYVACSDARQIAWVELDSRRVVRRVTVAGQPTDLLVTPDGTRLIVACAGPQSTVAVLDAETGRTTGQHRRRAYGRRSGAQSGRLSSVRLQSFR